MAAHDNDPNARRADSGGEGGDVAAPRVGPMELFLTFAQISLSGFGGTLFWVRHVLVERRRWMSARQFLDELALGQILPGPNIFNLIVMLGHRFDGVRGALAGLLGFLAPPFLIVIALGVLYDRYGGVEWVQRALSGMTAVAIGLVLANAVKLATVLPRRARPWVFVVLGFAGLGLLRLPILAVLAVLAPLAVLAALRETPVGAGDGGADGKASNEAGKKTDNKSGGGGR